MFLTFLSHIYKRLIAIKPGLFFPVAQLYFFPQYYFPNYSNIIYHSNAKFINNPEIVTIEN